MTLGSVGTKYKTIINLIFDCLLLFFCSNSISVALKNLPVKNQQTDVAQARLATFVAAKKILNEGMKILGIEPLTAM